MSFTLTIYLQIKQVNIFIQNPFRNLKINSIKIFKNLYISKYNPAKKMIYNTVHVQQPYAQ